VLGDKKNDWCHTDELPVRCGRLISNGAHWLSWKIEIPLSSENRYHSIFACLVSKELSTESNPPMMMTCGHVISKDSLQKLNKSRGYVYIEYISTNSVIDSCLAVPSALIALLKHRLGQLWGSTCNHNFASSDSSTPRVFPVLENLFEDPFCLGYWIVVLLEIWG
jgi:hypothetical protein